jgi:uncharacterized membrane protein YeiH
MKPEIQYLLEHFGVAIAAITGVLAARGKHVDLFGVIVLALVTAFGGGTIRDCTIGDFPVFWVKDPNYVFTAVGTAGLLFFVARSHPIPTNLLQVADAFVLALFTMVGLVKALGFGTGPAIGIVMGVITGVAGGILRDLLLGEIPLVFRPVIYLYATAAFFGALAFVLLDGWGQTQRLALAGGLLVTLLLRLAGIRWKLQLPVFVPKVDD